MYLIISILKKMSLISYKMFKKLNFFFWKRKRKNTSLWWMTRFWVWFFFLPLMLLQLTSYNLYFHSIYTSYCSWFWCIYLSVCTFLMYRDHEPLGYIECYIFAYYMFISSILIWIWKFISSYF